MYSSKETSAWYQNHAWIHSIWNLDATAGTRRSDGANMQVKERETSQTGAPAVCCNRKVRLQLVEPRHQALWIVNVVEL